MAHPIWCHMVIIGRADSYRRDFPLGRTTCLLNCGPDQKKIHSLSTASKRVFRRRTSRSPAFTSFFLQDADGCEYRGDSSEDKGEEIDASQPSSRWHSFDHRSSMYLWHSQNVDVCTVELDSSDTSIFRSYSNSYLVLFLSHLFPSLNLTPHATFLMFCLPGLRYMFVSALSCAISLS